MAFDRHGLLAVPPGVLVQPMADPVTVGRQSHLASREPLFAHPPRMTDVEQGAIGDCYLLAAINAILSRPEGADIIQCLLKDNQDGTVTIRFFKDAAFEYYRMAKTVVREYAGRTLGVNYGTARVLHNRGALWVSLIEKGYAACMRGEARTYAALEGGDASAATVALVGWGAAQSVAGELSDDERLHSPIFGTLILELSTDNRVLARIPVCKRSVLATVAPIFPEDGDANTNALRWYQWNAGAKYAAMCLFLKEHPTTDKFLTAMATHAGDLHAETRALVEIWIRNHKIWPGEVGSGNYLSSQLDLFAKIQRFLATQKAVLAGTHANLIGRQSGVGASAGEAKVDGLAANHAYTVLDTKIERIGLRFVLVRNPWGHYGRGYHRVQVGAPGPREQPMIRMTPVVAEDQAESWIELTDFSRNFEVKFGATVQGDARRGLMTNLDQQLEAQRARLKPVPPKP